MIEAFTDAQDQSWSEAVAQVHAANEVGVSEMGAAMQHAELHWNVSSARTTSFENELQEAVGTSSVQRSTGKEVSRSTTGELSLTCRRWRKCAAVYGVPSKSMVSIRVMKPQDILSMWTVTAARFRILRMGVSLRLIILAQRLIIQSYKPPLLAAHIMPSK